MRSWSFMLLKNCQTVQRHPTKHSSSANWKKYVQNKISQQQVKNISNFGQSKTRHWKQLARVYTYMLEKGILNISNQICRLKKIQHLNTYIFPRKWTE